MQEPSQAWPWHPHSTSTLVVDPMQRRMMHGKVMVWPRWDPRASSHEGVEPSDTAGLGLLGFRATKPPTSLTQRCGCPKLMASAAACCLLLLFFRFRLTEEKKFLLFGGRAVGAQGAKHTEPPSTGLVAGKGTATGQGNSPLYPNLHLLHGHKTPELCEVSPN